MAGIAFFTEPMWLGLLVLSLLPWLGRSGRRSSAVIKGLQSLILALIVCATARPVLVKNPDGSHVVIVWDRSASVDSEASRQVVEDLMKEIPPGRSVAVVGFAKKPSLLVPFSKAKRLPDEIPIEATREEGTDVSRALELAEGLLLEKGGGTIVLVSDGNETMGSSVESAFRIKSSGIRIVTLEAPVSGVVEVFPSEIVFPDVILPGERTVVSVRLHATQPTRGVVRLYLNDILIKEQVVEVAQGTTLIPFDRIVFEGRTVRVAAEVEAEEDVDRSNNIVERLATVRGPPRVLVIDPDPESTNDFSDLLRQGGFLVEQRLPAGLPLEAAGLRGVDVVVLSDTPIFALSPQAMTSLSEWVTKSGGGLFLAGGPSAYGTGGYVGTELERLLPVRARESDRLDQPIVALLVSLDRSGSMQATVGGRTKMDLANQGAALAMEVLGPRDFFGFHVVDTQVHPIIDVSRNFDRALVSQKIRSVRSSGGGIYVYSALVEAGRALRGADAKIRHVILFADAADAEEKTAGSEPDGSGGSGSALDLAASMASEGITLSVVALGNPDDKDTAWLASLAARGGGPFYLTNDALSLPQIFSSETMRVAQRSLSEDLTLATPVGRSQMVQGMDWSETPFLYGANLTELKPGGEELLRLESGEPLLAQWRIGLGQVIAFCSDLKNRWGTEWLGWTDFQELLVGLVRKIVPPSEGVPFVVEVKEASAGLVVRIKESSSREKDPTLMPSVEAQANGKESLKLKTRRVGMNELEAVYPLDEEVAIVLFTIQRADGGIQSVAWQRQRSLEWQFTGVNTDHLSKLASRDASSTAEDWALSPVGSTSIPSRVRSIDWLILMIAAVVAVIVVGLRRLGKRGYDV